MYNILKKMFAIWEGKVWIELTNAVFDGGIEGVDHCRSSVSDPVGFVDWLAQSFEGEPGAEEGQIEDGAQVLVLVQFQLKFITHV